METFNKVGEDLWEFQHTSWIRHVTYNPIDKRMMIQTERDTYECQGVPQEVFIEFSQAPSKGSYFNRNIKGRFQHEYFAD